MFKNDGPNFLDIIKSKKVFITRIVIFVSVFLFVAFLYLAFTPARYEVSARIAVNKQQHPADIINDIRTKNLINGAINKLQLTVSYYNSSMLKKTEIYGDSLPLKFVLLSGVKAPAEITVTILNDHQCEVNQDDTIEDIAFNRPETYSFGRFTVIKGPGFKVKGKPLVVKFDPVASLLADYNDKLDVKPVKNNGGYIDLSVETASIAKGADFLRFLGDALSAANSKPLVLTSKTDNTIKLNLIKTQLQVLEENVAEMNKRRILSANDKRETVMPANDNNAQKTLQEQVLETVKLSAEEPIKQFVQISFSNEVKDEKLKELVYNFNRLEMDKQRAFVNAPNPDAVTPVIDLQLSKLKITIIRQVDTDLGSLKNGAVSKSFPSAGNAALLDSIDNANILIKSKQLEYKHYLAQKTTNTNFADTRLGQSDVPGPEKSIIIYPKKEYIFIFAIFIGLMLAVISSYLLFYIRLKFFNRI